MAYLFWAVCFLDLILFSATYSQDSALSEPSPHHRGHRHDHHRQIKTLMAADKPESQGLHAVAGEEDDVSKDGGQSKVERGGDDGTVRGSDNTMMSGGLQDGWGRPVSPASSHSTPQQISLTRQQSSHDRLSGRNRQNPSQPKNQYQDIPGHQVIPAHDPDPAEHHSDLGIPDQGSGRRTKSHPQTSSREAIGMDRINPKDKQPDGPLESGQSPFFSEFPQIYGKLRNNSTTTKHHRNLTRRTSNRNHVNRPRWHFRWDLEDSMEVGKQFKSRSRDGQVWNSESDQSGSVDRSDSPRRHFTQVANVTETDHKQTDNKADHTEPKAMLGEHKDTETEKRRDIKRRGISRKPDSFKGRQKKSSQARQPKMKECVGCTKEEASITEARELHKQILKAQLLDKLRLVPTLSEGTLPPKLPEQVFPDLPQQDEPDREDQYYAKPTQLLVFGRDLGKHRLRKPGTGSYQFEVRGKVKGGVTQADLWVYKMHDARDRQGQTLVVTQLHYSKGRRLREHSLVARLDTHVQEGWLRFDVTRLVRRSLATERMSASSLMLAVRCKTCHRSSYRAIFGVKSNFRPVLVIREGRQPPQDNPREKRNSQCDPYSRCCKFDLTVRFHDLGIHEIFYPKTIRTGYCYGTCERPDLHYHNHTMIIQRLRFGSHQPVDETLRERLRPCCVPVVLREASVMHYVNSGQDTQVSLIPNLLVEKCGCA